MDQISYSGAKLQSICDTMDVNLTGWFKSNNKELYSRCVFSNVGLEKRHHEWQVFCGLSQAFPEISGFRLH